MTVLDVFKTNAYNVVSLTTSIQALPYVPTRISELGLFAVSGITTLVAVIEREGNKIGLVPAKPRGVSNTQQPTVKRKTRAIEIPHLPLEDSIMADDVQGVREFGTENNVKSIASEVNKKLTTMKQSLELTKEYHRIGALQGIILDADGSTELYDLFEIFGITETVIDFNFTIGAQDMKRKAQEVIRAMESALGGLPYTKIRAFCGNNFWDNFISHASVTSAFERFQDNQFAREQQNRKGFDAFGITWENYRGAVGGTDFINTDKCRFVAEGVPDLFQEIYAPANYTEAVNTVGKPWYAKQVENKWGTGVELQVQSNPLMLCSRPETLLCGDAS